MCICAIYMGSGNRVIRWDLGIEHHLASPGGCDLCVRTLAAADRQFAGRVEEVHHRQIGMEAQFGADLGRKSRVGSAAV